VPSGRSSSARGMEETIRLVESGIVWSGCGSWGWFNDSSMEDGVFDSFIGQLLLLLLDEAGDVCAP